MTNLDSNDLKLNNHLDTSINQGMSSDEEEKKEEIKEEEKVAQSDEMVA